MKVVRALLLAVVVTPALVALSATQALACSCIPSQPDPAALKDATAVFSGTVAEIEPGVDIGFDTVTWTFAVDQVYKGEVGRSQDVRSPTQAAACGVVFKGEKRYAVFAYENQGKLVTNSCMNTRPMPEGKELKLDPIAAFEPDPSAEEPDEDAGWDPFVVGAFGAVAVAGIVSVAALVTGRRQKT